MASSPGAFDALFGQLAEGGRMVAIVADARGARTGLATLFIRNGGAVSSRGLFSASAAPLPALRRAAGLRVLRPGLWLFGRRLAKFASHRCQRHVARRACLCDAWLTMDMG